MLERSCGPGDLHGEYFCNFAINRAYVARWQAAGLVIAACDVDGELRAFELTQNRLFIATLFQPQLSSSHDRPHPVVESFLRACAGSSP
jgi:CTP synthase (UTP-ammonia lyase)